MVIIGAYYAIALSLTGIALALFLKLPWFGLPFHVLAAFCLWFFRDPNRVIPDNHAPGTIAVSPADGKVVSISKDPDGRTRVGIFLNIFDVHVNRSPIAGTITRRTYRPGKFHVASLDAAASENEQNTFVVQGNGTSLEFSQIAGLIARRIIWYKDQGEKIDIGERVGLIQFGSRVDVLFTSDWKLAITLNQRVSAGSSIIAKRNQ